MSERQPEGQGLQQPENELQGSSDSEERTLVIIKPHAVKNREEIMRVYRSHGITHTRWRVLTPTQEVVEEHYAEHRGKDHFPTTVRSLCDRLIVYEFKGPNVIERVRQINGATNPSEAAEGTIRRQFGGELPFNAVHASSDREAAQRELELWFDRAKVVDTEPGAGLED